MQLDDLITGLEILKEYPPAGSKPIATCPNGVLVPEVATTTVSEIDQEALVDAGWEIHPLYGCYWRPLNISNGSGWQPGGGGGGGISDPSVYQRVDNLQWETAVDGVAYFSPDQKGGRWGKVLRLFFGAIGHNALLASGVSRILGGNIEANTGSGDILCGSLIAGFMTYNGLIFKNSSGELRSQQNGGYVIMGGYVDYAVTVQPVTSPTGQPFADPNSPLYKRVDTGAWELVQVGVAYYAKAPYSDYGDKALVQLFEGTGSTSAIITLLASGVYTGLGIVRGYTVNGATGARIGQPYAVASASAVSVYANSSGALLLERGSSADEANDEYSLLVAYLVP